MIVGVSTDEFNELKGKKTIISYEQRSEIVKNLKCVHMVIPENSWEQKIPDICSHGVTLFGMGADWKGEFDFLKEYCSVVYLPRTDGISSTDLKQLLSVLDRSHVADLKKALDLISSIVERFE